MTAGPSKTPLNVIPLTAPGKARGPEQRGGAMREAVVQVMTDLALERVPPGQRSPLFDAARELLDQAGRSPVEMLDAIEPGPEQDALFGELGLRTGEGE